MLMNVFLLSGPSGAGKTTVAHHLVSQHHRTFEKVITMTTRQKRLSEINAVDYFFLSKDDFLGKIKDSALLEYEEVYPGNFYGTPKAELERILENGKSPLLILDVKGAKRVMTCMKSYFPGAFIFSCFVTIDLGSVHSNVEELKRRLVQRDGSNPVQLKERTARLPMELNSAEHFDMIIKNNMSLSHLREQADATVKKFQERCLQVAA